MINSVVIIGRLTKDIEIRYTKNEIAVGNFTLAVNRDHKNQEGEYETDFINCTMYGEIVKRMAEWTHRGDLLGAIGRIQTSNYEDKDGNKRYKTEIIVDKITFLQSPRKKQEENPYKDMKVKVEADQSIEIDDSMLPF